MNSIYQQYLIVVVPQKFTFPVKHHHTNYGNTFPFLINYRVHYTEEFKSLINSHEWQCESSKMLRALTLAYQRSYKSPIICTIYHMLQGSLQNTKYITCMCTEWIGISLCTKWLTLKILPFTDGVSFTIKLTTNLQLSVSDKSEVNEEYYIFYSIIRITRPTLINQVTITVR